MKKFYTVEVYEKEKLIIVEDFNEEKDALDYFNSQLDKHITETVGDGIREEYEMTLNREVAVDRVSIHVTDPNNLWHVCVYDIVEDRWVSFTRDSFATDEDWETLCETVDADPDTTTLVKIWVENNYEIEEEDEEDEEE